MEKQGLTEKQANERLKKFGENRLRAKKRVSWLKVLLDQFKSPLIYILVIASGVTAVLGDFIDAGVIGAAVILNTILGFYQEIKAEKSLEALSKLLTPKAKVIRNGKRKMIEARLVVPGDICVLEIGERVPADGLVVEADSLSINEAILTGESVAVEKEVGGFELVPRSRDRQLPEVRNQIYMGTTISSGIGLMKVTKIGQETEIGKIADKLAVTKEEKTPLQKRINKFSKKIAIMVGIISVIILAAGWLAGDPFIEIFTTAVAVAVSAIPEGLAVSLTVILAIGMQRIFKKKALVRKLVAAETLGSVTVICTDKTGTLTEGKMRVVQHLLDKSCQEVQEFEDVRPQRINRGEFYLTMAAMLCNDMRDPLEIGMMDWAKNKGSELKHRKVRNHARGVPNLETLEKEYPRLDEIPFDPEYKYIATLHKGDKKNLLLVSGAPEVLLNKSSLTKKEKLDWLKKFEHEAKKGRRLVGFAYKQKVKGLGVAKLQGRGEMLSRKEVKDLQWLGVLIYEDPIRTGVAEALKQTKKAGIKTKVITGDYRFTAEAVVNQLELERGGLLSEQIMEGTVLAKISDEELKKKIDRVVLFVRTKPEQKLRIVKALQEKGEVVAMTGDGVNDAPAIKKADIGIVVDEASAVAKETADMVLLDSNFETIVGAIEEGRGISVNFRKVILYLLSDTFSEVILVLASIVFGLPLAVTAGQILWINLVDDGLPNFALTMEPKPKDLMKRPAEANQDLLDSEVKWLIGLISLVTGILALAAFSWYFKRTGDLKLGRTMVMTILGFDSLLYVFSCKTLKKPLWRENLFDNYWLWGAVLIGVVLQLGAVYLPFLQTVLKTEALNMGEWGVVLLTNLMVIALIELVKFRYNKPGIHQVNNNDK